MATNLHMFIYTYPERSGHSLNSQRTQLDGKFPLNNYTAFDAFSAMFYRVNKALVSTKLCTNVLGTDLGCTNDIHQLRLPLELCENGINPRYIT